MYREKEGNHTAVFVCKDSLASSLFTKSCLYSNFLQGQQSKQAREGSYSFSKCRILPLPVYFVDLAKSCCTDNPCANQESYDAQTLAFRDKESLRTNVKQELTCSPESSALNGSLDSCEPATAFRDGSTSTRVQSVAREGRGGEKAYTAEDVATNKSSVRNMAGAWGFCGMPACEEHWEKGPKKFGWNYERMLCVEILLHSYE
eukprot:1147571-Pelagomonas_calceolata.AAC.3